MNEFGLKHSVLHGIWFLGVCVILKLFSRHKKYWSKFRLKRRIKLLTSTKQFQKKVFSTKFNFVRAYFFTFIHLVKYWVPTLPGWTFVGEGWNQLSLYINCDLLNKDQSKFVWERFKNKPKAHNIFIVAMPDHNSKFRL